MAPALEQQQRRGPPDLAEILRQKKEADAEAAKPKFIRRKDREKLEAEKLEAEKKAKQEEKRVEAAKPPKQEPGTDRAGIPTGPKAMRIGGSSSDAVPPRTKAGNSANRANGVNGKRRAEDSELEAVRTRYMGPDLSRSTFTAKKKRRHERTKFSFDWDPSDDTTPVDYHVPQIPPWRGFAAMENYPEDVREKSFREHVDYIRSRDHETGEERAKDLWDQYRRDKERKNKSGWAAHWSDKPLEAMRERDWRIFKENFGISVKGGAIPNPMRKWKESDLPPRLLDIVERVGYDEPTPIQRAAIPLALQARDLIGVAVTGSGKTASFLLPLLVYIKELPPLDESSKNDGPYALILAPTRELAQQIEVEAKKFATPFGYTVVSIVGGHSLEEQAFALRNGAEIIVATPGRLVDCIERRLLVLSQCCYIIMDEADRMIDLGFEESLTKILEALPVGNEKPDTEDAENAQAMTRYIGGKHRYRQTMMYTATMPPLVEKIARKYLRRPAIVTIGNVGEAVETVEQRVEFISGEDKRKKRLQEVLNSGQFAPPIIVFVNIKRNCDMVAKDIRGMGYSAVTLHGSKTQEQREAALASVREGKTDILVATDLAGRGIDVIDVSLVVNFNMAMSIESYTHRIGRTGRAGKSGVALTFLGNEDNDVLYDLKQMISKSSISKLPDELRRHEAAQQKPTRGGGRKEEGGFGGKNSSWN